MSWASLIELLPGLPERHVAALSWFAEHAGEETTWPQPLADGTLLAGKAKGIYKPAWSKYALSVRRSLQGPYPDREIEVRLDGSWRFEYFQEHLDPMRRDAQFTNIGLVECWKDVVPVGVMVQIAGRPRPRYRVHGLALVTGWDEGYFYLEGSAAVQPAAAHQPTLSFLPATRADAIAGGLDPAEVEDQRRQVQRTILLRQGQQGFRRTLLSAYGERCAITGCDAKEALEAAHIVPYRGPVTNHPSNGLLLRADIHNLFDLGLLAIDPGNLRILMGPELQGTVYRSALVNSALRCPTESAFAPSHLALENHRQWAHL